jgi:hypothetical protein
MGQTYRDLLWLASEPVVALVARSESRGYQTYTVMQTVGGWTCTCPAKNGTCWHVKEAPKALFYVRQRERFRQMGDNFAAFFNEWWPRYEEATKGGDYLGKSCADWQVFFAALLDEEHERKAYTRKYVSQVKDIFSAVEVE